MMGNIVTMVNAGSTQSFASWRLTIPKAIVESLGFEDHTILQWIPFDNNTLFLKKVIDSELKNPVTIERNVVKLQKVKTYAVIYYTYRVSFPIHLAHNYEVDVGQKWCWIIEKDGLKLMRYEKNVEE